jgi:dTDP-4-amino-4,6-dideoxygalactose transaminase
VLSFGRGKGITGGHGGALLGHDPAFDDAFAGEMAALGAPARGWTDLGAVGAQWVLGRPALYAIPSAIPGLRLGEMVYHPAHTPRSLSAAAAALVARALRAAPAEVATRRRNAAALTIAADEGGDVESIALLPGAVSGMLRFPVRDTGARPQRPELGVLRGYPQTLHEQSALRDCLQAGEPATPGAAELRRTLFTLPTHSRVTRHDLEMMIEWLRVPMTVLAPVLATARRA